MSFCPTLGPARPVCSSAGLKISKDPNLEGRPRCLTIQRPQHLVRKIRKKPAEALQESTLVRQQATSSEGPGAPGSWLIFRQTAPPLAAWAQRWPRLLLPHSSTLAGRTRGSRLQVAAVILGLLLQLVGRGREAAGTAETKQPPASIIRATTRQTWALVPPTPPLVRKARDPHSLSGMSSWWLSGTWQNGRTTR